MTNKRLFRWTLATLLVGLVAWVWWTLPASASEPEPLGCRWYANDLYWGARYRPPECRRWHRWRHRYHKPAPDAAVMSAQIRLQNLGYEIEADGFMGAETREALVKFQAENDLEETGEIDRATKRILHESEHPGGKDGESRQCHSEPLHIWSGQHNTEAVSKGDAQKRWMIGVQARHGSIWMNFSNATAVKWRCFQSQSHDTLLGKAQSATSKILGGEGYFVVCELWATPCAAPVTDEGE
jgi:hypothetical protein